MSKEDNEMQELSFIDRTAEWHGIKEIVPAFLTLKNVSAGMYYNMQCIIYIYFYGAGI